MYRTKKTSFVISLGISLSIFFVLIFAGPTHAAQWKVIDLTHKWQNGMPIWQGKFDGISLSAGKTREENYKIFGGWWLNNLKFSEHTGTHIDAPAHRKEGLWKLDDIPVEYLFGKAIVMDMRPYVRDRNAYMITMADVRDWERKTGVKLSDVARHGFVYMWTGWDKYWYDFIAGKNDKFQVPNFPGISGEVGDYLAHEAGIVAFGMDVLSIDPGPSKDFAAHIALYSHGIYGIENLNNLAPIANRAVFVIHAPMKIRNSSGAPTRVWAIYDPEIKSIRQGLKWADGLDARIRACRVWELTNYIENGMHVWQGVFGGEYAPTGLTTWIEYEKAGGFWGQKAQMNEHTGTHIDSASHRIEGRQWTITDHPVSQFYGPAVIIDASSYGPEEGDWILSLGDFKDWQRKHPAVSRLNKGDLPIFYLGWVDEWVMHVKGFEREKETYHFPGIGGDVAKYLVEVGVDGVGTDVTSIDAAKTAIYGKGTPVQNNPTHVTLCGNGIWNCENMGLQLPLCLNTRGYVFFMTMPYCKGGSGGSTRVFYFEGLKLPELEG